MLVLLKLRLTPEGDFCVVSGERGDVFGSYLTRVLHTARISNVDVALCGERMKDGNFLGSAKEMCSQNRRCESSRVTSP